MLPENHWIHSFRVASTDIENLTTRMLEIETPMNSREIALALIEDYQAEQKRKLENKFKDVRIYNPSFSYQEDQRIVFPALDFATAQVVDVRSGENPDYGTFGVVAVQFDNEELNTGNKPREFATELTEPHKLADQSQEDLLADFDDGAPQELIQWADFDVVARIEDALTDSDALLQVARYWFPAELIMDVDVGHLHLAEAVIDMAGEPLATAEILNQIGGLGSAPEKLQTFSLNYAMSLDDRFDEVGPAGEVMWFLKRLEPEQVLAPPRILQYHPIAFDESMLTPELQALEQEILDELSFDLEREPAHETAVTLIYPHRRAGTLPINAATRHIFPDAQAPRTWIQFIDTTDNEVFIGWVVHEHRFVYGLESFYHKHHLPIGTQLTVAKGDTPGQYQLSFDGYRPRTEWVQLVIPSREQIRFDTKKRSIGAAYDDLMIVGVDELEAVDALSDKIRAERQSLAATIRKVVFELSKINPQGSVHAKSIYSAVNVFRRCPPGPIFATLVANPDFEAVGDIYWRLSD